MFYSCFIESILTFSFIAWYGATTLKAKSRLQGVVKVCSKVSGCTLSCLSELFKIRVVKKARQVLAEPDHPLGGQFVLLPSGRRYRLQRCRTNRLKNSFVPSAIMLLNSGVWVCFWMSACVFCRLLLLMFLLLFDVALSNALASCCCKSIAPRGQ